MIIRKLENKTVQEQDTVELEVELSRPSTEVKWMKNGIVLQPEGNLNIKVDGVKQTLIFKSVTYTDRGFYCCETLDDKTQAKLTVESKSYGTHCLAKKVSHYFVGKTFTLTTAHIHRGIRSVCLYNVTTFISA